MVGERAKENGEVPALIRCGSQGKKEGADRGRGKKSG